MGRKRSGEGLKLFLYKDPIMGSMVPGSIVMLLADTDIRQNRGIGWLLLAIDGLRVSSHRRRTTSTLRSVVAVTEQSIA
jgi:hypothetical protein